MMPCSISFVLEQDRLIPTCTVIFLPFPMKCYLLFHACAPFKRDPEAFRDPHRLDYEGFGSDLSANLLPSGGPGNAGICNAPAVPAGGSGRSMQNAAALWICPSPGRLGRSLG